MCRNVTTSQLTQASLVRVAVDHYHVRSVALYVRIELVVPCAEERVGHIETLAVQAQLDHLRSAA